MAPAFSSTETTRHPTISVAAWCWAAARLFGTQGVDVYVTPSSIPTSGTILVNEQSQLVLNGVGTYGAGTTLDLNGGGIGPGVSTGSSGALRTSGSGAFTYAGNVNIGTGITDSAALGFVVISATKGNTVTFSGSVSGTGNIQKQGGGADPQRHPAIPGKAIFKWAMDKSSPRPIPPSEPAVWPLPDLH